MCGVRLSPMCWVLGLLGCPPVTNVRCLPATNVWCRPVTNVLGAGVSACHQCAVSACHQCVVSARHQCAGCWGVRLPLMCGGVCLSPICGVCLSPMCWVLGLLGCPPVTNVRWCLPATNVWCRPVTNVLGAGVSACHQCAVVSACHQYVVSACHQYVVSACHQYVVSACHQCAGCWDCWGVRLSPMCGVCLPPMCGVGPSPMCWVLGCPPATNVRWCLPVTNMWCLPVTNVLGSGTAGVSACHQCAVVSACHQCVVSARHQCAGCWGVRLPPMCGGVCLSPICGVCLSPICGVCLSPMCWVLGLLGCPPVTNVRWCLPATNVWCRPVTSVVLSDSARPPGWSLMDSYQSDRSYIAKLSDKRPSEAANDAVSAPSSCAVCIAMDCQSGRGGRCDVCGVVCEV